MSQLDIYNLCCKYHGETVRITCNDGRVHVGKINRVNRQMVWICPTENLGGYGLGFFGRGFGFGIALGAITGIALASAFFW